MSTHFAPRAAPTAAILGRQLHVRQSIDHGNGLAAMVQRSPYSVDIAVLLQQINGINLAKAVGRYILRQPECLGCSLDILPNSLAAMMFARVKAALKDPPSASVLSQVRKQRLR